MIRQQQGRPEVGYAQWGLVPSWLKDTRGKSRPINARSETVSQKPFFRGPWRHHRCLLPADGFYEWLPPPEGEWPWPKREAAALLDPPPGRRALLAGRAVCGSTGAVPMAANSRPAASSPPPPTPCCVRSTTACRW
ncbi:MAG: hypothetical protein DCF18_14740 [Cyanobium sp.]|nr:MAG: hypothetical protein DCF18_14740 [Cyanobium sp.]